MPAITHPPPFCNPPQSPTPPRHTKALPAHSPAHAPQEISSPQPHSSQPPLHSPPLAPQCFGPSAISIPQRHRYDINTDPYQASHDRCGHALQPPSPPFALDRCTNPPAHNKSQCLYMSPTPSLQMSDIFSHQKSESFVQSTALSYAKTKGSWQKRVNLQPNIKL